MNVLLSHEAAPCQFYGAPPDWIGAPWVSQFDPDAPPEPRRGDIIALINPTFRPALADLVAQARRAGVPVIGVFETMDFDFGLWPGSPLQANPHRSLFSLQTHVCALARMVGLCDGFVATGPVMAESLARQNPRARVYTVAPAPPETTATAAPAPRRLAFAPAMPGDTTALAQIAAPLAAALEALGLELLIADEPPPPLARSPRVHQVAPCPDATARAAFYAAAGIALFAQDLGQSAPGAWLAGLTAEPFLPALAAQALCYGHLPEQARALAHAPPCLTPSGDPLADLRALRGPVPAPAPAPRAPQPEGLRAIFEAISQAVPTR